MSRVFEVLNHLVGDGYGIVGIVLVALMVFLAVGAPLLPLPDPNSVDFPRFLPPSPEHLFGTDNLGSDVMSRTIWGARVSIAIGLGAALISSLLGALLGAVAGLLGGAVDATISRVIEIFLMLPTFFLAVLMAALFGSSMANLMVIIGITTWPTTARIVRGATLSVKERLFVEASRALGASSLLLLRRHILPNIMAPTISYTILQIGRAILIEAGLSYLGLGDPNVPSWGRLIYRGQAYVFSAWWIATFPGLFLVLTVLGFNLLGDSLLRYINPKLRRL